MAALSVTPKTQVSIVYDPEIEQEIEALQATIEF